MRKKRGRRMTILVANHGQHDSGVLRYNVVVE